MRPLPTANRTLDLDPNRKYDESDWPLMASECPEQLAKFSRCAGVYKTIDYNTFAKNGCLKLSEIEMFFISSKVTKQTSSEWVLVYIGIGTGERFRWVRDEFFPGLAVVAFDPLEGNFSGNKEIILKAIERWNNDGTNFTFLMRCFELEKDSTWILEKFQGKKLLLISDTRGITVTNGETSGVSSDKKTDQHVQWQAVQRLRPERSLVKFACPTPWNQVYEYAPGVLLKQIFCYYGTRELRLMIDGVPEQSRKYNVWELYEKMMFHHEHLRGLVYKSTRRPGSSRCLDCSFDCTVLWDTISSYARKNDVDAYTILDKFIKYHVYSPSAENWDYTAWKPPTRKQRWDDVEEFLKVGKFMEAIAALELEGEDDAKDTDWADIVKNLAASQPQVAQRLKIYLHRPASRASLIQALGSLSDPFTLVGNELNLLYDNDQNTSSYDNAEPPPKRQRTVWDLSFTDLTEAQQKAATSLGWVEATWNTNKFHLPKSSAWDSLTKEMQQSLSELGESADSWDNWKVGG